MHKRSAGELNKCDGRSPWAQAKQHDIQLGGNRGGVRSKNRKERSHGFTQMSTDRTGIKSTRTQCS
jgi:hypothetical protein